EAEFGSKAKGKSVSVADGCVSFSGRRTTLVVCPPSVFSSWITQLEEHTSPGKLKVYMYYGGERTKEVEELKKYDIILTTYSTLATEESWFDSPMKKIEWWRVILDEAHVIKNANAQQSKAVTNLKATCRWVVTGTPIQNGSFDLFSLMAFLRFEPFSIKSYWRSLVQRPLAQGNKNGLSRLQVLMASISLRRIKGNNLVGLPPKTLQTCYVELSVEERELYDQIEGKAKNVIQEFIANDSLVRNYSTVLGMLLRLRQICTSLALLPLDLRALFPSSNVEGSRLHDKGNPQAAKMECDSSSEEWLVRISSLPGLVPEYDDHAFRGSPLSALTGDLIVFCCLLAGRAAIVLLMDIAVLFFRLFTVFIFIEMFLHRDVSNNPELLKKMVVMLQDGEDFDCPICISPPVDVVITRCAHIFCRSCILKTLQRTKPCCPLCRQPLSQSDLFSAPPKSSEADHTEISSRNPTSSKVSALLSLLRESRDQKPATKSVVFSQFRTMLLLLEKPLTDAGFKILRLDGSMNAKKRAQVIEEFQVPGPDGPTVLLASLKASGAGINLTAASRVYLIEPWWNPAVEEQAMDRVHRIGQKEDVKIVRLIARNSIEERVLELQERKKKLATEAFGRKGPKNRKEVTIDDLRTLMSL
ncbi:hypothetical protein Gohar_000131, partial [Gossypium harknessii]|nr:hypothetical protein [Gossypium harknessii]